MFYDLCQSTVALRKQHKLLLQHITSRGSRLAPFKPRWPLASFSTLGGRIPPPPPHLFPGFFRAREWYGVRMLGGRSLLDIAGPSSGLSQGCTAHFHHLLPQQIKLSVPFDPISCTWTACSFMVCSSCPSSFSALLQSTTRTE